RRQSRTVRCPTLDVMPIWIKLLLLQLGVENAKVRSCVGPTTSNPLPVERVTCLIRIDKRVPEPGLAKAPVISKVLGQQRSCDHTHAIVHESRLPELLHSSIDNSKPGLATF